MNSVSLASPEFEVYVYLHVLVIVYCVLHVAAGTAPAQVAVVDIAPSASVIWLGLQPPVFGACKLTEVEVVTATHTVAHCSPAFNLNFLCVFAPQSSNLLLIFMIGFS